MRLFVHCFPIELEFRTVFDLVEGGKQENTEKTLGARRELKTNSTQVWHMFHDSYPDHIVGNECFFNVSSLLLKCVRQCRVKRDRHLMMEFYIDYC